MPMDNDLIERVLHACDIVQVISSYIPVIKKEEIMWQFAHSTMIKTLLYIFRQKNKFLNVSFVVRVVMPLLSLKNMKRFLLWMR